MSVSPISSSTWVLILKKAPAAAKSRLSGVLDEIDRKNLVEKLFQHVLAETLLTRQIDNIAVISPQQPAVPADVRWIKDKSNDLNQCVLQGLEELSTLGATRILVLPSDLPLLNHCELAELISAGLDCDMVIAPDEFDSGTNALLLQSIRGFKPRFGIDSFHKHLTQAQQMGLNTRVIRSPGLAFDLDDESDWKRFCASENALSYGTI